MFYFLPACIHSIISSMEIQTVLYSDILSSFPEINHGFSTKHGSLDQKTFPFVKTPFYGLDQVHGSGLVVLDSDMLSKQNPVKDQSLCVLGRYDGVITRLSGVPLVIKTADCLPVKSCCGPRDLQCVLYSGPGCTRCI